MTAAVDRHITHLGEHHNRTGWLVFAMCSCGWLGPDRRHRVSAEDDSARHLLDVTR